MLLKLRSYNRYLIQFTEKKIYVEFRIKTSYHTENLCILIFRIFLNFPYAKYFPIFVTFLIYNIWDVIKALITMSRK